MGLKGEQETSQKRSRPSAGFHFARVHVGKEHAAPKDPAERNTGESRLTVIPVSTGPLCTQKGMRLTIKSGNLNLNPDIDRHHSE